MPMQTQESSERCVHATGARTQIVITLNIFEMIITAVQVLLIQWLDRLIGNVVYVG
jgi:hypothetical protein